jgi:aminomethyltransferase
MNTPIQAGFELVRRGIKREGYLVALDGQRVGYVTTGKFSSITERYVDLAYVPREISKIGAKIGIVIRGKTVEAMIVKRPFYVPVYRRLNNQDGNVNIFLNLTLCV